jgi:hypothetical protein
MAKQGKHKRKVRRDRLIYEDYLRMQRERKYLYAYICESLGTKYHLEPITIERILVEQRELADALLRQQQPDLPFDSPSNSAIVSPTPSPSPRGEGCNPPSHE